MIELKKWILIITSLLIVILLISVSVLVNIDYYSLLDIQGEVGPLAHKVMEKIDKLADTDGECIIDIRELTNFNWDTMIAVNYFCPLKEIAEIPEDFHLKEKDVWTRLIFLKDDKVVYNESYRASVEAPYKFNLEFIYEGNYKIFTPDNAQIPGHRFTDPQYPTNDPRASYFYSLIF